MTKQTTTLMNFRIPNDLKNDFNIICKIKHTAMTAELLKLIKMFIKDEISEEMKYKLSIEDLRKIDKPEAQYKKWGSFIYDIKNGKWLK
jgi:uncharacterized protein YpmS